MIKFIKWLKSNKSDVVLFIAALVLLNLVSSRAYIRIDLTKSRAFSLSPLSRTIVRTLREPLSIRVYFSDGLPARYKQVQQYLDDLLVEYKGKANKNFSYTFVNMKGEESEREASDYGLHQMQIQEVKNNEVGFKTGYMGLVISYMDQVDTIDGITSTASLEYNITTKIGSMIQKADALSALKDGEKIQLTLYLTDELKAFNIAGFDDVESIITKAAAEADRQCMGRLSYRKVSPPANEMEDLAARYGVQVINWKKADGSIGMGVVGLVATTIDEKSILLPLTMERSLFGYVISGLEDAQKSITDGVSALMSKVSKIGYITGHGEVPLEDEYMASLLSITRDMYSIEEINLKEKDIPLDMGAIVINGPKASFTKKELYRIDQAVMRGVSAIFLIDPYDEEVTGWGGGAPSYIQIDSGIEVLLTSYGVTVNKDYVLDENCYVSMSQDYGDVKLYPAPLLQNKQLSSTSPVTEGLANVLFYKCASIDAKSALDNKDIKVDILAASSKDAWTIAKSNDRDISLNPLMITVPDKDEEKERDLAVMLEGSFKSAFEKEPVENNADENNSSLGDEASLTSSKHRALSAKGTRIFVAGTSELIKGQLLDEKGEQPVAVFMRNVFDYISGNEDLCSMRTKGLTLNTLHDASSKGALLAKYFNMFGIALLSLIFSFILSKRRKSRRHLIHDKFNKNDTRTE